MTNAANLGLVRPPIVYLGSLALGLAVHYAWPVRFVPASVGTPVGATLVLLAVALFVAAVRTFRAAGTPVPGNQPTTVIVRSGPYRYSRNPIYLAFTLFQLGLAVWINSVGLLITLVPAVLLMALVVIPKEERYLEARFPSEYSSYRASVRRWLTILPLFFLACSHAAPAERYGFVALLGNDTVSVERIVRSPSRLVADGVDRWPFVRRRHTEFSLADDGTIRHMVMDVRTPNGGSPRACRSQRGRIHCGPSRTSVAWTSS